MTTGWETIGVGLKSYKKTFEGIHQVCGRTQGRTVGVTGPTIGLLRRLGGGHQGEVRGS